MTNNDMYLSKKNISKLLKHPWSLDVLYDGRKILLIVFTGNKSGSSFFQTKMLSPTFWKESDFVIGNKIVVGKLCGQINAAAVFYPNEQKNN